MIADAPAGFERLDAMVAAQWALTPDLPAIHHRGRTLLYRDLAASVDRKAALLIAHGVSHGGLVGVHMGRTPDLVAVILAILRIGAAYVPLDPGQPAERAALILKNATLGAIVTDRPLGAGLDGAAVTIDSRAEPSAEGAPAGVPIAAFSPDDLACVIYTSGSTGEPKGVALAHTASRYIRWAQAFFADGQLARVAATTSISFDPSIFELFAPLSAGGAIVLKDNILDPFVEGEDPTLMQGVPSAFAELVRGDLLPRSLRVLNIGGEPLSAALCGAIHARLPGCRLFNHYGPTEASICTSVYEVKPGSEREPTLGEPICGARILILDDEGNAAPPGTAGEMVIMGDMLARGYHGRPDLTAARFAVTATGERLYRTGDRGLVNGRGEIEFLGRLGDQVKVNGVRIELAEVEAGLMRVPGVDRALAAVKPDDNGRQRLVAYLPTSYPGTLSDVRAALKNRLPSAMLPSALVRLDHFPLTETGKLDRRALPAPGFRAVAVDRVQPHHAPDRAIAAIFAQVLQMPGFGLDDDFFDTGGDSLLLIEACLRIEELFGRTVPSGLVVQAPTPRLLAEMLRLQHTLDSFEHLVPITPGPVEDPIFWACDVHGQAVSMIAIARHLGRQALGLVPGDAVAMSSQPIDLWQLCERYAEEVIRAKPHGAYVICGYSFGGPWAFGVAVCLERMGREVTLALVDPVNNLSPGISLRRIVRGISIFVAKLAGAERGGLIQRVRLNSLRRLADPMQLTGTVPDFVPESALSLAQRLLAATGAFRSGTFGGPSVVLLSAKRNGSERAMNDDGLYGWRALLAGPITAVTCKASHEEMAQEAAAATARQLAHALQRAAVGAGDSAGDAGGVAKSSARRPRDLAYERLPISQGW